MHDNRKSGTLYLTVLYSGAAQLCSLSSMIYSVSAVVEDSGLVTTAKEDFANACRSVLCSTVPASECNVQNHFSQYAFSLHAVIKNAIKDEVITIYILSLCSICSKKPWSNAVVCKLYS